MLLRSWRLSIKSVRRFASAPELVVGNVDAVTAESLIPKLTCESFINRHVGPDEQERSRMLASLGFTSREHFMQAALPKIFGRSDNITLPRPKSEQELCRDIKIIGRMNQEYRSYIGQGYYGTLTPSVIQRNILENPAWYTSYTPYQPEISQGRLEGLFNFQTMICELTGFPVANASLLDEASAVAEAVTMLFAAGGRKKNVLLIVSDVYDSTISCLKLRAQGIGVNVVQDKDQWDPDEVFAVLVQYPDKNGCIDLNETAKWAQSKRVPIVCATDPMALVLLKTPKDLGFSVAVGSTQRFGVPMAFGGPHAAFFACKDEYRRLVPGRIVGLSKDSKGQPAFRLALQTREQHIRRDKATSNICTSQALLANISAMYAVYHGPDGLLTIAKRINTAALFLADIGQRLGLRLRHRNFFDTLVFELDSPAAEEYHKKADARGINLRKIDSLSFGVSVDETVVEDDLKDLVEVLAGNANGSDESDSVLRAIMDMEPEKTQSGIPQGFLRTDSILNQPVFNERHSEAELTRYIHRLACKDVSLIHSMIPLGSCTMKLNGTTELQALSMPSFMNIHPLAPLQQTMGYDKMLTELKAQLAQITGFPHVCLQPNSGAQGELLAMHMIKKKLAHEGQKDRNICIVPVSAHGTNAASAALAGLHVASVKCTRQGKLDLQDLDAIINSQRDRIAALIITYPSTFGVFDDTILKACQMVKDAGGFVYLDGANMNAMVGYIRPADLGVDVCHLNLHKTFCIPHGGGGPGAGPIAVSNALAEYLPAQAPTMLTVGSISSAFHGSSGILPISWAYIKLLGREGLRDATYQALLSANYMMKRLAPFYPVRFVGENGLCAHEFIIDLRQFEATACIQALDVAKRLQDYGFHAPTMSWPVPNTLMIEPTESEGLCEIDRYLEALVMIREEIREIEEGRVGRDVNLPKMAPHTMADVCSSDWNRPYSRERAAFPTAYQKSNKIWPSVNRLDDFYGDQNLVCSSC